MKYQTRLLKLAAEIETVVSAAPSATQQVVERTQRDVADLLSKLRSKYPDLRAKSNGPSRTSGGNFSITTEVYFGKEDVFGIGQIFTYTHKVGPDWPGGHQHNFSVSTSQDGITTIPSGADGYLDVSKAASYLLGALGDVGQVLFEADLEKLRWKHRQMVQKLESMKRSIAPLELRVQAGEALIAEAERVKTFDAKAVYKMHEQQVGYKDGV